MPCEVTIIAQSLSRVCLVCDPLGSCPPGSSAHGIFQVRMLQCIAISYSGDLPDSGIEPASPVLAGRFFTHCTTWEAPKAMTFQLKNK